MENDSNMLEDVLAKLDRDGGPTKARFMVWLLVDPEHGCIQYATDAERPAIQAVADLWARKADGEIVPDDQWDEARASARAAAWAAARAAAWASARAAAWASARDAKAGGAAWASARDAAWAAGGAAWASAWAAARDAKAGGAAWDAAFDAARSAQLDCILELQREDH